LGNTIRGDYLNPSSNPFLQQSVNDALGLAKTQFAGQYGGQAGGNLGNSGYQEMLMRTLGNVATNAYSNAYGQERQNQLQATQLAPSMDLANVQAPFARWKEYSSLLQNNAGGGTQSQPYFTNPMGGALGGALAGGQLFGMMGGGQQSLTNPFSFGGIPGYGG
jgi:membrane protease subunit (stomatin/prohibitin family)